MAELKTPLKLVEYEPNDASRRKAYALVDDGGAWLCTFHRAQREGAEAIKDAVNRDAKNASIAARCEEKIDALIAQHAETVLALREQRDALITACARPACSGVLGTAEMEAMCEAIRACGKDPLTEAEGGGT